jgi:hypothetical protein
MSSRQDQRVERSESEDFVLFTVGSLSSSARSGLRIPRQVINHNAAAEPTPVSVAPTGHDTGRIWTHDEGSGAGNKRQMARACAM